jgi:hypothetical protein
VRYSCNTGGRPLFDTRPTVARLTAHEEAAQSGGVVGWILHHPDRSLFRKVLRRGRSEEPETPLKMYCTWSVRPRVMRHRVAASSSSCTMASSSSSTTRDFALGVIMSTMMALARSMKRTGLTAGESVYSRIPQTRCRPIGQVNNENVVLVTLGHKMTGR